MTKSDESEQIDYRTTQITEEETRYLEQTALLGLEYVLSDFAKQFQKSARRWELMAYPAMVVFGLLAISGFWLIYSLTQDMHVMSGNLDPQMAENMGAMSENVAALNQTIGQMNDSIVQMTANVNSINAHMIEMNDSMKSMKGNMTHMSAELTNMGPLLFNIAEMNQSMKSMTVTTGIMSHDMKKMNRPMRLMNNMLP